MSDLLSSLKSDLLDRRLLPLLALLALALAGAIAYVVLGGGSSGETLPAPASALATRGPASASLSVSQAPTNPNAAVAETTDGARLQHHSGSHNPFAPLQSAASEAQSTTSSTSPSTSPKTSTGSSSSGSPSTSSGTPTPSGSGGEGASPTTPTTPAPAPKKPKPHPVYLVSVLFGLAPTTPGQLSQLTPFNDLKRLEPLPSASEPRIIFAGATDSGAGAVFALAGEAILKGEGACIPSATQCEAVDLAAGKSEEFSYLLISGQTISYELKVVTIEKRQASAARAARLNRRDHAGTALIRRLAPPVLEHLRFSSAKSLLVYVAHHG